MKNSSPFPSPPVMAFCIVTALSILSWAYFSGSEDHPGEMESSKISVRPTSERSRSIKPPQSEILSPHSKHTSASKNARKAEQAIDKAIAAEGGKAAAEEIRRSNKSNKSDQRSRMESLTNRWSQKNPKATWQYISEELEPKDDSVTWKEYNLWESAVSGYVEGVIETDPDSAANAAALLQIVSGPPREPIAENDANSGNATGSNSSDATNVIGDPGFPGDPDFLIRNKGKKLDE